MFVPDATVETFAPGSSCGGSDGADGRAARYLDWTWSPDPAATVLTEYIFVLRDAIRLVSAFCSGSAGRQRNGHLRTRGRRTRRRRPLGELTIELGRLAPQAGAGCAHGGP